MTPLWKYEGLGNDLIFFRGHPDGLLQHVDDRARWMRSICDRHRGVGADGIMFVDHTPDSDARALVSYFNSDGTAAEMCGNGLRCAALFMHHEGLAPTGHMFEIVMNGAGRKRCKVLSATGRSGTVEVEIGVPRRGAGAEGRPDRVKLAIGGIETELIPLSVSNPHAVILGEVSRTEMDVLGPAIEHNRLFPDRVNVEFANVRAPNKMDLVVWERGCGFTQACGSGACAAVAASIWEGLCDADTPVEVILPGGTLHVTLDSRENVLWLRGRASLVFRGEIDPQAF